MAHVPSVTTDKMELVTFRQALEAANTPSEEYDVEKWLYAPDAKSRLIGKDPDAGKDRRE